MTEMCIFETYFWQNQKCIIFHIGKDYNSHTHTDLCNH